MWYEAWRLALVEIKKSVLFIMLSWLVLWIAGTAVIGTYNWMESPDPYHDALLIAIIVGLPLYFRRKIFRLEQGAKLGAAPIIIHYAQLPIPKLVMGRMPIFIYLIYFVPPYLGLFAFIYFYDGVVQAAPLGSYLLFSFCLLALSLVTGLAALVADFGTKFNIVGAAIVGFFAVITVFLVKKTSFTYGKGLFLRLLDLVADYPIWILAVSILMIGLSLWLFPLAAVRKLRQFDY